MKWKTRYELRKWFIIGCLKCHLLQIVRSDQKKRKCPKCGYTITLHFSKIKVWFKARNVKDATYALQKLKLLQKQGKLR